MSKVSTKFCGCALCDAAEVVMDGLLEQAGGNKKGALVLASKMVAFLVGLSDLESKTAKGRKRKVQ